MGATVFNSIVVATDGSPTATEAVRRAWALTRVHSSELHIVSAYCSSIAPAVARGLDPASLPAPSDDRDLEARESVERLLEEVLAQLSGEGGAAGVKVTTHAVGYEPVTAILDVAKAHHADLIVVGNKGMRGPKQVLGSVPDLLARKAACDVLIVNTT
jgi:nucleotide-binding universal stress UspA family protein